MNRFICFAAAAVMLVMFIKDTPIAKKIWVAVTAAVSAAAMIYIAVVYYSFGSKLKGISYEYADRAKLQSDFNTYIICIFVLLLVAAAVFVYAYNNVKKCRYKENYDSCIEYIVIGIMLVIAIVIYFIGTSFAVTHISKFFDISFYPMAVSAASIGTVVFNLLLYMKILQ